jgi:small-conductance mechanosensitive channel
MYRSVIDRVLFRLPLTGPVAMNLRWGAAALVAFSLGTSMAASAQRAPFARVDSSQVIHFLNQTIDWYRHRTAEQQLATEPDDVLVLNENRQLADQVVRLAFEFAQAEAESLGNSDAAGHNQDTSASPSQYQALLQLETKITQQAQESQTEVETLRQKLETATGKKRQTLQAQLSETQAELDLAKARKDTIHNMTEFVSGTGNNGPGATDLRAQVQALADSVPAVSTAKNSDSASKDQLGSALIAATNKTAPSGVWDLSADLFALSRKIHTVDVAIQQTDTLAKKAGEIRSPFISRIKELSTQGDELAKQADSASPSELERQKQQLDSLAAEFRQIAAVELPLSKQRILLQLYQRSLSNWRSAIQGRRMTEVKGLLVRLGLLAIMIGIVVVGAELWRRAVYRYVHNARRRYQALLLRKLVMWFMIVVIVAFAFASKLGSVVTFAGLITAGIVVALQNVILSIVGYFLLIGKFGIRVGDRVQIGGVTGEVIDIGLVRLHLMELSGGYIPTGRVVAFSNTVVFQPTAGLFKQIPGTNFLWHEITLRLAPETDYKSVKKRLLQVVETVLGDYREELERQNRAMENSLLSTSPNGLRPQVRVRFSTLALEVVIRFPVDLHHADEIDEHVTRELLRELDREPKLKFVDSDGPGLREATLTYS